MIAIGTILYLNFGVYHKTYRETQKISHNGLVVKVMDSVLTDMDQGGRKIKDEKIYLAVSLNVTNRSLVGARLDYENFKVLLDKKYIMPTLDRGSYFPDFGTSYTRDTQIPAKESKNYVLTYEFDEGMKNKNFNMRILESLESTLAGITPVYKEINLKYDKVFTKKDVATYQLGKIAEFSKTRLGLTQVQFKEYQLGSSFTYDYKKCNASNCQNLKGIATIDPKYRNKTILAVKKKFQLDPTSMYFQVRGGGGSFVNDFLRVRYQLNDKIKEENVINITPLELKDWWVLLVPSETAKASKIDILIDVRGSIYVMNLKEK